MNTMRRSMRTYVVIPFDYSVLRPHVVNDVKSSLPYAGNPIPLRFYLGDDILHYFHPGDAIFGGSPGLEGLKAEAEAKMAGLAKKKTKMRRMKMRMGGAIPEKPEDWLVELDTKIFSLEDAIVKLATVSYVPLSKGSGKKFDRSLEMFASSVLG
ncbi:hypothetical protein H0H81_000439 [Sphagnurus paluster]|uniref:Uncharacterized protein n=1 Tax=Sphagnurus paluster TaxID=117069 RepID=A0A9P7GUP9_9AGAR|nr:hypothetical protein H0H81_000439 [Sphagnurus paluster]